jgi:uncharacterized protein (DUF3084 family)
MTKLYILIPVIGMAIFAVFYTQFNKEHKAKLVAAKVAQDNERKEKAKRDIANRELAIKSAVEAQEKRKQEREERDRVEEAKKKARQDAEDKRQRAFDDRKRTRDQVERLKKEVDAVKAEVAKLNEQKQAHVEEQKFLRDYVKQAEANVKYYYDLLDKLAAAEQARAAAEAAAAAAAKKG